MSYAANVLTLLGLGLIRWGGRGGGSLVFTFFGFFILGMVVWALIWPGSNQTEEDRRLR